MKKVHPVNSAGIRIHDLLHMSHLPQPLDHSSRPYVALVAIELWKLVKETSLVQILTKK